MSGELRRHHYVFAHQALREACADDPAGFFERMRGESWRTAVNDLWTLVGWQLEAEASEELDPEEIEVEACTLRGSPCVLVRMPPPIAVGEAHFVALVLCAAPGDPASVSEEPAFRCFTLERTWSRNDEPRTVIGEWVGDRHLNFADGPGPDATAFLGMLEAWLGRMAARS